MAEDPAGRPLVTRARERPAAPPAGRGFDDTAPGGTTLRIRRDAVDEIVAHARDAFPDECCGLLVGTPESVECAVRARNLREGPARYLIDPADHFAAIRTARDKGLSVVGAYHSHPAGPPFPSETDVAEATSPAFVYLIVSAGSGREPPVVRAFRLAPGAIEEVELMAFS